MRSIAWSPRGLVDRGRTWWGAAGVYVVLVLLLGVAAHSSVPPGASVVAWWPPAGLTVAFLAFGPARRRPVVLALLVVAGTLAGLIGNRSLPVALGFSVAAAVDAGFVIWFLSRGSGERIGLRTLDDLWRLLVAAFVGAFLMGALCGVVTAITTDESVLVVWRNVVAVHGASMLLVAPLGFELRAPVVRPRPIELALHLVGTLVVFLLLFSPEQELPLLFLPIPLLVFSAMRVPVRVVVVELVVVDAVVSRLTNLGYGPLAEDLVRDGLSPDTITVLVQVYLVCLALVALPLCLSNHQRREVLAAERSARHELEGERDFSRAVLDSTATLIVVIGADGRVARFNPAAEALSGRHETDVIGRPVSEALGTRLGELVQQRQAERHTDSIPGFEADWLGNDGEQRSIVWTCAFLDPDDPGSAMVITGVDVTEQRSAQALFQSVFAATTGTSIIGTDVAGTITFFNPGAEHLLGYTAEEVVGKATPALFHDPEEMHERAAAQHRDSEFGLLVDGVEPGRAASKRDWRYVRKDGRRIVMSLRVSAMTSSTGRVIGYLGVAEDVTERARVEELLRDALAKEREAVERLNDVDRAQTEFVSAVSHELRTPITSVLGYTQMLLRGSAGALSERQAGMLSRVEGNALRLQSLIEDVLSLSRIEGGTFDMQPQRVDLREVVQRAGEAVENLRVGRHLDWQVRLGDRPVDVQGDEDQLDRALINLLSNAIKFTPDGGSVSLTLDVTEADGDRPGEAVLSVRDTGIGIPADEQPQLFTRFFRASTAQHNAIPGTGLGLAIVQSIVDLHHGSVTVRSNPDTGTTVEVRLPREVSGSGRRPRSSARGESAPRG